MAPGPNLLLKLCHHGRLAKVQQLLHSGTDPKEYQDPLLAAAFKGHSAIVQCLLAAGADKDTADGNGATPLLAAAEGDFTATLRVL